MRKEGYFVKMMKSNNNWSKLCFGPYTLKGAREQANGMKKLVKYPERIKIIKRIEEVIE
jgi:hypothetical protein